VDPDRLGPPYPIVFVHGFSGFHEIGPLDYFFGVLSDLEEMGETELYAPALPPYNASQVRAQVLAQVIDDVIEETNRAKVHLIAHSQGGIDSRRVVAGMGYADRVASVTTIATPHHGTPLADLAEASPDGVMNPAGRFLAWMIGAVDDPPNQTEWDDDETGDPWDADMAAAVDALSSAGMEAFNEAHPNPPGVGFFSLAGYSNLRGAPGFCDDATWDAPSRVDSVDPLLVSTGLVLNGGDLLDPRANDGVVPTDSGVWGTFLGCVPADHFDEVGQIADLIPGVISGFDHLELYRRLVTHLRAYELAYHP
jgi:triacylglycerol lipase